MTDAVGAVRGRVLVTGTSTGIGRATALVLAGAGFTVHAGVRDLADGERVAAADPTGRVRPVLLDVTDPDRVGALAAELAGEPSGLAGLVNNAGIGVPGPVEMLALDRLRHQFEVNVVGQVAVTQAVLPLLRAGNGRIVTVGSVGSWVTLPFGGALCASKHALRSLNDALRMELRPWGVPVVLVEPGTVRSPAIDKLEAEVATLIEGMTADGRARYAAALREMVSRAGRHERAGADPAAVARVVLTALTRRRPRTRYPVGPGSRSLRAASRWLPAPAFDAVRCRALGLVPYPRQSVPDVTAGGS